MNLKLKHCNYTLFIAVKPRFEEGKFQVEYNSLKAVLSWPKPSGDFTKQAIWKKPAFRRRKRAISECEGECVEEEVPLGQTTHTTDVDFEKKYEFKLVLYDGDVEVQSIENPVTLKVTGKSVNADLSLGSKISVVWTEDLMQFLLLQKNL